VELSPSAAAVVALVPAATPPLPLRRSIAPLLALATRRGREREGVARREKKLEGGERERRDTWVPQFLLCVSDKWVPHIFFKF
jgi:hypothetical protein